MVPYNIFNPDVVMNMPHITVTENIEINEDIEKQHEQFRGKKNLLCEVKFETRQAGIQLVRLFGNSSNEQSKMSFLTINNFPDACFYRQDTTTKVIDCYICELKHSPANSLDKLPKQFFMGWLHCQTIFAAVRLDEDYDINYHFMIIGLDKKHHYFEKQVVMPDGTVKAPPGVRPIPREKMRNYRRFIDQNELKLSFVHHSQAEEHQHTFQFRFISFRESLDQNKYSVNSDDIKVWT